MERKDYLINRLKKDFLQYCWLQEDSLPAEDIVDRLYHVVDLTKNTEQNKKEIRILLDKYFSFEKVKVKGNLSNGCLQIGIMSLKIGLLLNIILIWIFIFPKK